MTGDFVNTVATPSLDNNSKNRKKSASLSSSPPPPSSSSKSLLGRLRIIKASPSTNNAAKTKQQASIAPSSYPKEVVLRMNDVSDHSRFGGYSLGSGNNNDDSYHNDGEGNDKNNNAVVGADFEELGGIETTLESMRRLTKKPSRFTFDLMPSFSVSADENENESINHNKLQEENKMVPNNKLLSKNSTGVAAFRNRTRTSSTVAISDDDDDNEEESSISAPQESQKHPESSDTTMKKKEGAKHASAGPSTETTTRSVVQGAATPGSIGFWPSLLTPDSVQVARSSRVAVNDSSKLADASVTSRATCQKNKSLTSADKSSSSSPWFFPAFNSNWTLFG